MYFNRKIKDQLLSHLQEHLYFLENSTISEPKKRRIIECKSLIALIEKKEVINTEQPNNQMTIYD